MAERVDVAILGGGCAGLSLAVQLAENGGSNRRVAVIEKRDAYERDRTWCGWSVEPHAFAGCVDRTWSRWKVRSGGEERLHASARYAYEHIRADRFYDDARRRIERARGTELSLGVAVESVTDAQGGAPSRVRTSAGELLADVVVDTRPPALPREGGPLLQHFIGWEVETARPAFDPTTATLMDFDVDQDRGAVHFMYVLPFSRSRALVESTVLSPEPLAAEIYESRIAAYVEERHRAEIESVHFVERGAIPMAPIGGPGAGATRSAGTAGGAVKPSSGYAFHAIQRTTARLAAELAGGSRARHAARSRLDGWLDRVFLSFLQRHPERGPEVFFRLFDAIDADAFARFMMERPGAADRLRVIGSMPKLPFAREALRVSVA